MATRRGSTRIAVVAALAAVVAIAAIGWAGAAGSKAAAQRAAKAATVQTKKLKKLGTVLVNSKGLTLYMFVPDKQKKVTCTSTACVIVWPPLKLKKRAERPRRAVRRRRSCSGATRAQRATAS